MDVGLPFVWESTQFNMAATANRPKEHKHSYHLFSFTCTELKLNNTCLKCFKSHFYEQLQFTKKKSVFKMLLLPRAVIPDLSLVWKKKGGLWEKSAGTTDLEAFIKISKEPLNWL